MLNFEDLLQVEFRAVCGQCRREAKALQPLGRAREAGIQIQDLLSWALHGDKLLCQACIETKVRQEGPTVSSSEINVTERPTKALVGAPFGDD